MHDLARTMSDLGRRLTDAGREARQASTVVAKEVIDQLTTAIGAATGEVVRAAVVGAVAAIIRSTPRMGRPAPLAADVSWEDPDGLTIGVCDGMPEKVAIVEAPPQTGNTGRSGWFTGVRRVSAALTVAAGAAAAVPGGRLVAAGLGAAAAVAGLAARAGDIPVGE